MCHNPLYTGDSLMRTLAKSVDPDEMKHNVAFYGLHCLLIEKQKNKFCMKI